MFSVFYDLILCFAMLFVLPKFYFDKVFKNKKRSHLLYRLGIKKYNVKIPENRTVYWVHAVSMGETKACISLLKKIKENNPDCFIVFSSITETGHAQAKKDLSFVDFLMFLPFDFSWIMKRLMKAFRPSHVILIETDIWYNFLKYAKKVNAKTSIVSAKISKRSKKRLLSFKFFAKKLFSNVDLICAQNDLYKDRFLSVCDKQVVVTGNLKYDSSVVLLNDYEINKLQKLVGTDVFTIASTHHPEESLIFDVLSSVFEKNKNVRVFVAPRHPERFNTVKSILLEKDIPFVNFSEIEKITNENVIFVDSMGKLNICYQLSKFAIVGGSFTDRIGGHNVLEPIMYSCFSVFGNNMSSQEDMKRLVLENKCGQQLTIEDLESFILYQFDKILDFKNNKETLSNIIKGSLRNTFKAILG